MIRCQDSAAEFPYLLGTLGLVHDLSALEATTNKTPPLYRYLALYLAMEVFSEEAIQGAILRLLKSLSIRAMPAARTCSEAVCLWCVRVSPNRKT